VAATRSLGRALDAAQHIVRVAAELAGEGLASLVLLVVRDVGDRQFEESGENERKFLIGEVDAHHQMLGSVPCRASCRSDLARPVLPALSCSSERVPHDGEERGGKAESHEVYAVTNRLEANTGENEQDDGNDVEDCPGRRAHQTDCEHLLASPFGMLTSQA
jgi:hypothetical protein